MKKCSKCKALKPLEHFNKNKSRKDGLANYCRICNREYKKSYYAKNPDSQKLATKIYRKNNPEKIKANNKKYWEKNKELLIIQNRKRYHENSEAYGNTRKVWARNNRARVTELELRRRARIKKNKVYKISNKFLKKLYSSECVFCGQKNNITMDHIIPVKKGGSHGEGNLQPLCNKCNSSKNDKLWIEWVHAK